uniref:Putative oxidoreductase n=1 Tax=Paulinella chromatophora TaxID=39717 RepID=B1X3P0_PAUCH|nr:putative oxidoreductase [Paulinella chromatophora]ACB42559.1 putative oxidoreductase [Paulinella chromatophora]
MDVYRPIGIAIAGLGFREKVHLPALRGCPNTEPVAVWHPCKRYIESMNGSEGLECYTDFDELLQDPRVEGIVIATPPASRFELAKAALNANKHILLDSPICLRTDQIQQLQRSALSKKLSIGVDLEYRAIPIFQQLAQLIHNGVLGNSYLIKLDWLMGSRISTYAPSNWYSQENECEGIIGNLGIHSFDLLHWLIGPLHSIAALKKTIVPLRPISAFPDKKAFVKTEDIALLQLELKGLSEINIAANLNLSSVTQEGRGFWAEFYGNESTLIIGGEKQNDSVHSFGLWMAPKGHSFRLLPTDPSLSFDLTWNDSRVAPVSRIQDWWAISIRSGQPMVPGLGEGYWSQKAFELAQIAAKTEQRQYLF